MCEGVSLDLTHPFCYIVCRQAFVSPSLRVAVTAYTLHCRCMQVAQLLHAGCSVTAHRLQRYCILVCSATVHGFAVSCTLVVVGDKSYFWQADSRWEGAELPVCRGFTSDGNPWPVRLRWFPCRVKAGRCPFASLRRLPCRTKRGAYRR